MAGPHFLPPLPQRARTRFRPRFSLSHLLIVFVLTGPLLIFGRHLKGREDLWQLVALVSVVGFGAALIMFTARFASRLPVDVVGLFAGVSAIFLFGSTLIGYHNFRLVQHAVDTLVSPFANRDVIVSDVFTLLSIGAGWCVVMGLAIGLVFALAEELQR